MNRVLHYGVVDQNEANTLAKFQMDRLSLGKLASIEAPDIPLHIAGEMKNDFASRWASIHAFVERAQLGISQHATAISIQPISRIVEPWRSVHSNTDHFRANVQRHLSFLRFGDARGHSRGPRH